jgi:hypothetical protein
MSLRRRGGVHLGSTEVRVVDLADRVIRIAGSFSAMLFRALRGSLRGRVRVPGGVPRHLQDHEDEGWRPTRGLGAIIEQMVELKRADCVRSGAESDGKGLA